MLDDSILQPTFIGKLSQMVSLTAMEDHVPMNKLCETAGKLMKVLTQVNLVAVARTQNDEIAQVQENRFLKRQIRDLTKKINSCKELQIELQELNICRIAVRQEANKDTVAIQIVRAISVITTRY